MRPVRTLALLAALLLPSSPGLAAPWSRPSPRAALEVHASLRGAPRIEPPASAHHALRDLPATVEHPDLYALVTRWIEAVAVPGPDGKPKLVPVTVRGGLGLAFARRW